MLLKDVVHELTKTPTKEVMWSNVFVKVSQHFVQMANCQTEFDRWLTIFHALNYLPL
jgi:hypothetical protein